MPVTTGRWSQGVPSVVKHTPYVFFPQLTSVFQVSVWFNTTETIVRSFSFGKCDIYFPDHLGHTKIFSCFWPYKSRVSETETNCVLLCAGGRDFLGWLDPAAPSLPVWSQRMCEGATGSRGTSACTHTTARVRTTLRTP